MTTRVRVARRPERTLPEGPVRPAGSEVRVLLKETGELKEAHEVQVEAAALPLFDVHRGGAERAPCARSADIARPKRGEGGSDAQQA